MEELLASIRRIVADNQMAPIAVDKPPRVPPPASLPTLTLADASAEADEFELPAMFRQDQKGEPARETSFVARLTDAIRGENKPAPDAASSADDPMADLRERPTLGDAPLPDVSWDVPPLLSLRDGLGSPRIEPTLAFSLDAPEPAPASAPPALPPLAAAAEPPLSASADEVRRVMAPCKDTLIARMGQPVATQRTRPAPPPTPDYEAGDTCYGPAAFPPLDIEPRSASGVDGQPSAIPQAVMGERNFLLGAGAAELGPGETTSEAFLPPQLAPAAPRRLLPRLDGDAVPVGYIPESTAALLRPLLMQWLDDNMHRAFTKALHVEAAENAKGDKF